MKQFLRASSFRSRFPPPRRDADVGQTEQALNPRPFADVIAFDPVPKVLQQVSQDKSGQRPIPRNEEQENDAEHGQRDSNHVNPKIERMPMPFPPVLDDAA